MFCNHTAGSGRESEAISRAGNSFRSFRLRSCTSHEHISPGVMRSYPFVKMDIRRFVAHLRCMYVASETSPFETEA